MCEEALIKAKFSSIGQFKMNKTIFWLYPKLDKWMGGTRFVFECCKRLGKQYDLKVVCQKGHLRVLSVFMDEGLEVISLQSPTFTDLNFWVKHEKNIRDIYNKVKRLIPEDALIITSMYPMNYIASQFDNKHIQVIYEPFSFFYNQRIEHDYSIFHYIFFRIVAKLFKKTDIMSVQKADVVLTLSSFEKNNIKKIYNKDSDVIFEGVDTSFFYPRDFNTLGIRYHSVVPFMHSTGFDSYKGTDLVIDSLPLLKKHISNFKLFLTYTRVNKNKMRKYLRFIKDHNLEGNIEIKGFLPYEELPIYYSFAKVYVEPGIGRSMSLSNKEAMACGTPVIRGNDSTEEVIDGETGFLVDPFDKEAFSEKVALLLTNNDLSDQMGQAARDFVLQRFNWDEVVKRIVDRIPQL